MKLKNWQISSPVLAIQTAVQGGYRLCCFLIRMLVTQVYLLCKNHWVTQFCMCVVFQQKVHYNEKKITKRILRLWHLATLFVKFVGGGRSESKSWVHFHLFEVWQIHSRQAKQDNYYSREATGLSFLTEHYLVQIHSRGMGCATTVKNAFTSV